MWDNIIFDGESKRALIAFSAGLALLAVRTLTGTRNFWVWGGSILIVVYFVAQWFSHQYLTFKDLFLLVAIGLLLHGIRLGSNKTRLAREMLSKVTPENVSSIQRVLSRRL